MPVTFKRRTPPGAVQSIAPAELTERQKTALIDAGLLPAETPQVAKPTCVGAKREGVVESTRYRPGDKAVVVNDLYTWVKDWKAGDTGTVLRTWPPLRGDLKEGQDGGLIELELDSPRVANRAKVIFRAWEIHPIQTVGGE